MRACVCRYSNTTQQFQLYLDSVMQTSTTVSATSYLITAQNSWAMMLGKGWNSAYANVKMGKENGDDDVCAAAVRG